MDLILFAIPNTDKTETKDNVSISHLHFYFNNCYGMHYYILLMWPDS